MQRQELEESEQQHHLTDERSQLQPTTLRSQQDHQHEDIDKSIKMQSKTMTRPGSSMKKSSTPSGPGGSTGKRRKVRSKGNVGGPSYESNAPQYSPYPQHGHPVVPYPPHSYNHMAHPSGPPPPPHMGGQYSGRMWGQPQHPPPPYGGGTQPWHGQRQQMNIFRQQPGRSYGEPNYRYSGGGNHHSPTKPRNSSPKPSKMSPMNNSPQGSPTSSPTNTKNKSPIKQSSRVPPRPTAQQTQPQQWSGRGPWSDGRPGMMMTSPVNDSNQTGNYGQGTMTQTNNRSNQSPKRWVGNSPPGNVPPDGRPQMMYNRGGTPDGLSNLSLCKQVDSMDEDATMKSQNSGGAGAEKGRGSYRCGRCGVPKKGHVCPYQPKLKRRPDEPPPVMKHAATQVEIDEYMILRRLNLEIQGFPESYASEPQSHDMVGTETHHPTSLSHPMSATATPTTSSSHDHESTEMNPRTLPPASATVSGSTGIGMDSSRSDGSRADPLPPLDFKGHLG